MNARAREVSLWVARDGGRRTHAEMIVYSCVRKIFLVAREKRYDTTF